MAEAPRVLNDRYEVQSTLGRGGMAQVYLATDRVLGRSVAVKILSRKFSADEKFVTRFRREAQASAGLNHPHVVSVFDTGSHQGLHYIVMEYVEGETLGALMAREGPLPPERALRIAADVAEALESAHRQDLVHRDVKPGNVMIDPEGRVKVVDFGIARAAADDTLTQTGLVLGTAAYLSPEQARGDRVDARTDIYSLGCVLYEMLAGTPPFTGPTSQAVIARHALDEVPSLTVVRGTISDDVEDAVMRAMSKVPADRFATATEFAEALHSCRATGGRTIGRGKVRSRGRKRASGRLINRRMALGAAGGILAMAGIALAYWPLDPAGTTSRVAHGGFDYDPKRIAVLYFDDESTEGDLGHLADGLTEGLIDELQPISALDVISRNGVAQFRGKGASLDSIARTLRAGTIVQGSVDRVRNRVVVEVRLFEGNTRTQIRRASIELPESDVLLVRDSVPAQVAKLLREPLGEEVRLRASRAQTSNATAWLVFQRAERVRKEARRLVAADSGDAAVARVALADSLFGAAEALDPQWAEPILSRGSLVLSRALGTRDNLLRADFIGVGLEHAERALALDARNAAALELRGTLRYMKRFFNLALDPIEAATLLRTAEEDLRAATRIDPQRASAWNTLSLLLYRKFDRLGSYQAAYRAYEADAYLESAKEILWRLYTTSYDLENFASAHQWCDEGDKRYPAEASFASCRLWLTTTNLGPPDPATAWRWLAEIEKRMPAHRWESVRRQQEMLVAVSIARAGDPDSAHRVIERARAGRDIDPAGELIGREVLVRTLIGDKEKALELLSSYLAAFPQHREGFVSGNTWWWRTLQGDPRFKALVGS